MLRLADRIVKAVSDVTVGTVIVLVHVALAERSARYPSRRRKTIPAGDTRPRRELTIA